MNNAGYYDDSFPFKFADESEDEEKEEEEKDRQRRDMYHTYAEWICIN